MTPLRLFEGNYLQHVRADLRLVHLAEEVVVEHYTVPNHPTKMGVTLIAIAQEGQARLVVNTTLVELETLCDQLEVIRQARRRRGKRGGVA